MNVCTAVGAIDSKKNYTITFKSEAHKIFYLKYLPECRYQDFIHITARFPAANLMPTLLQLSRQLSCSPGRVICV